MTLPATSETVVHPTGYEEFFGFSTRPFSLSPDLRFIYPSHSHSHAFDEVTTALQRREGLVVITGEIGTGKTVLCRALLETFHEKRTFLSVILDPLLSVDDLLYQVLADFGLLGRDARISQAPLPEATRHQLVTTLQQFLASLIPLNAHAVIMIDEAQHLSPAVLEQIRLLSNFETERAKLLQTVLVGQPSLETMLRHPDMRQLDQRIARRIELHPLSNEEVRDYIARRVAVAGAPEIPFTTEAIAAIRTISQGIPRVINTLCDRALEIGCERTTRAVGRDIVGAAAERLKLAVPATRRAGEFLRVPEQLAKSPVAAATAVGVIAVLVGGLWWWLSSPSAQPAPALAPAPVQQQTPAPSPQPSAGAARGAPPSGVAPSTSAPPAAAPAAPAPASAGPAQPSGGAGYRIAVAAFRTSRRANDVASDVASTGLPVAVRIDSTGQWYQVIVGPFATAAAAENAQRVLARQGYPDTRISAPVSDR